MKTFMWIVLALLTAGMGAVVFFFYKRLKEDEAV